MYNFCYDRLLINKIFPEESNNLKMLADVFKGQSSGETLRGWKVLHAAMCWRTQSRCCKMINSKSVLTSEEWRPLTTKCWRTLQNQPPLESWLLLNEQSLLLHNLNNPTHNTTLLGLTTFQGFFVAYLYICVQLLKFERLAFQL